MATATGTRKTTVRRTVKAAGNGTRKTTTAIKTRKPRAARVRRQPIAMTPEVREAGGAALAAFEEAFLKMEEQERLNFDGANTRILKRNGTVEVGMQKSVKLLAKNGTKHRAVVIVRFK